MSFAIQTMYQLLILGIITINCKEPSSIRHVIIYLLLLTIFLPQYLGTIRFIVADPPSGKDVQKLCKILVMVTFSPIYMYVKHFQRLYLELKLRELPNDVVLIQEKETLKREMNFHIKLELGLESIYQLSIMLILLFLSYTETPTQIGLQTVFNEGLGALPLILLGISILLSFKSCITAYWKAILACREHFPLNSRITVSLFCLNGLITRVLSIVLYFAVPLGLFSLHRHLQAEQYPWRVEVLDFVGPDGMIYLGDNEPFRWSKVDRWKKMGSLFLTYENGTYIRDSYTNQVIPNPNHLVSPPDYTSYVGTTLSMYLLIFFIHLAMHMVVVYIAKHKLSPDFKLIFNLLDKIIHCLENTNIPFNAKEWDDGKGNAEEHRERMKSNWIEGFTIITINFVFNTSLLIPLSFLGK